MAALIIMLFIIEFKLIRMELSTFPKTEFQIVIAGFFNEVTSFSNEETLEDLDDYGPVDSNRISIIKCNEYKTEAAKFKRPMGRSRILAVSMGKESNIEDFPHMGALGWKSKSTNGWNFLCSSSLISLNFILTAAHCTTVPKNRRNVYHARPKIVRFGVTNIKTQSKYDRHLAKFYVHPSFKSPKQYFDIALIKLRRPMSINKKIQPACLWVGSDLNVEKAIVTGWGRVSKDIMEPSPILESAPVDIIDYEDCKPLLSYNRNFNGLSTHQICAVNITSGAGSCERDSGAPLQVRIDLHAYVIGVTAFGRGCGSKSPGVYTSVSKLIDWIEVTVWGS